MRCSVGTSWRRRWQTCSLLLLNWPTSLLGGLASLFLVPYLTGVYGATLLGLYLGFILFLDRAPDRGGRKSDLIRRFSAPMYRPICDYFPVALKKTTELDPTRPYVFGTESTFCFHRLSFAAIATFSLSSLYVLSIFSLLIFVLSLSLCHSPPLLYLLGYSVISERQGVVCHR